MPACGEHLSGNLQLFLRRLVGGREANRDEANQRMIPSSHDNKRAQQPQSKASRIRVWSPLARPLSDWRKLPSADSLVRVLRVCLSRTWLSALRTRNDAASTAVEATPRRLAVGATPMFARFFESTRSVQGDK